MLLGVGRDGAIAGRRVAVTGLERSPAAGSDVDSFWDGLLRPAGGLRTVPGFDPLRVVRSRRGPSARPVRPVRRGRPSMALEDAGDVGADPERSGVIFGTGVGGF